jgi:hypothetical protein
MVADRFARKMRILGRKVVTVGEILDDSSIRPIVAELVGADQKNAIFHVEGGEHHPCDKRGKEAEDDPLPAR